MQLQNTCCIIGEHPQFYPTYYETEDSNQLLLMNNLREHFNHLIEYHSVRHFISGMSLGVEQYAAHIIQEFKEFNSNITLEGVIPYELFNVLWTEPQRDSFYQLMEQCDKETLLNKHYSSDCIKLRNEYMILNSHYVILVWNRGVRDTRLLMEYAKALNKNIILIDIHSSVILSDFLQCSKYS